MEENNMKKFYICRHCGNLVEMVHDAKVPMFCCGEKLEELVPNTVEASGEKHIPVPSVNGDEVVVRVGSVDHPMIEEHSIQWVWLETDKGGQMKYLEPRQAPEVKFSLNGEKPVAVAAWCNLHGLWMAEI
jgi:superoxide reductase